MRRRSLVTFAGLLMSAVCVVLLAGTPALAQGTITGTVTDTSTGLPIQNVQVSAFSSSGGSFGQPSGGGPTNSSGVYSFSLPAGSYYLKTGNSAGYQNEAYDNVKCLGCANNTGSTVTVASGGTVTANFGLDKGGTITGTVTDTATGNPLSGVTVNIYGSGGGNPPPPSVANVTTGANGTYTAGGLATGTYYAQTSNNLGYVNKAYNNVQCLQCSGTTGTGIPVTAGQTTSGKDFALQPGGTITGTVKNASTNATISNAQVNFYTSTGSQVAGVPSGTGGVYASPGLPAGTYYAAVTNNSSGLVNQWSDGTPYFCCQQTPTGPLTVAVGAATPANFALPSGGTITGKVTDAGTGNPLASVTVRVYYYSGSSSNTPQVGFAQTDPSGVYTIRGLATGSYYAQTSNSQGYVNKAYDNFTCLNCSNNTGAVIAATQGATTSNINFALERGGAISGTVTDATTNAPLSGVTVNVWNSGSTTGPSAGSAQTNGSGVYTVGGLPTGSYYVQTSNSIGYVNKAYDNLTCLQCSGSTGTPVAVTVGATTAGTNFALDKGGTITGKVTNASTGAGVNNVQVQFFTTGSTQSVGNTFTDPSGVYTSAGLPAGTYYAATTSNGSFLVNTWSDGTPYICCQAVPSGPFEVALNTATTKNIALPVGGQITGTVRDASTSVGLTNVTVRVYSNNGSTNPPQIGSVQTNPSGVYTVGGLPTGSYYAQTSNTLGYVNKAYDNLVCLNCSSSTGALIAATQGATTSNINFALERGGSISGTITDAATTAPLAGVMVNVWNSSSASGPSVGGAQTNASGVYTVSGLPTGSYYAQTNNSVGYVNKAYDNFTCLQCNISTGTPVAVTVGTTTAGTDFKLDKGGTITGTVKNASTNAALSFVSVGFFNSAGTQVASTQSNNSGVYTSPGLPAGTYYAATTFNNFSLVNQWSDGTTYVCCQTTPSGPLAVTLNTATTANLSLPPGGQITGTVTSGTGALLANVTVRVYLNNGSMNPPQVGQAQTNASGVYAVTGLPTGSYYAQTSNTIGYVNKAYTNVVCLFCSSATGQTIAATQGSTTSGIDFVLESGGAIAGKVTDAASPTTPLANVQVQVFATGSGTFPQQVGSTQTTSNGTYLIAGLPGGAYYARTSNSLGYVNKAYNDVLCVGCSGATGNPIAVAVGTTTGSIDFALNKGGAISGTVTSATGTPLANVSVNVYTGDGSTATFMGSVPTNAAGVYTFSGLPTGAYYAQTYNNLGYVNEAYDNVTCLSCNGKTGKAIAVTVGSTTGGINFALDAGGSISGTVTNAATGLPLPNVQVNVYVPTAGGGTTSAGSASTSASGTYAVSGLPTGSYYVQTRNSLGFVNKAYNNVVCLNCNMATGSTVAVTVGATTSGISFSLDPGGSITGVVTDTTTGAPLANVTVNAYSSTGGTYSPSVSNAFTNAAGVYTVGGLPTGKYNLQTYNSLGYANKAYNNVACSSCPSTTGTPIDAVVGTTITGINFALGPGGTISGKVTDVATGSPLANVGVNIYTVVGSSPMMLGSAQTNAAGVYSYGGLQTGTYFAQTYNSLAYLNQAYNGVFCLSCSGNTGTGIAVTLGATTGSINFSLDKGLTLSGSVTNAATGAAISSATVSLYSSTGAYVGQGRTDANGAYVTSAVQAGTYFASTSNSASLINKLYDGIACVSCASPSLVVTGKPITLASGTTPTANFALAPGGVIAGTVRDASTSNALFNVQVQVYDTTGSMVTSVWTNNVGRYWTTAGLQSGTYFVRTSGSANYIDQVYKATACAPCTATAAGTPVTVTAGSTTDNIDFALGTGGSVAGTVKDSGGSAIAFAYVQVYNTLGTFVRSAQTDSAGAYSVGGLDAGTYYARTSNSLGFVDKVFDSAAWSNNALTGTPIAVTMGAATNNINFQLVLGGRVTGKITDATTGLPLAGVSVSVADASNNSQGASTDASGTYTVFGLGAGTYYARSNNSLGYIDQLFNNLTCSTCSMTSGTPLTVTVGNATTANFALTKGGQVSGVVTNAATGKAVSGASVQVFSSTGSYLTSGRTDDAGRYTTNGGLDTGKYFVKTNNGLGFIDQLYSGYPCAFCSPTSGTPVSVTAGSTTSSINFSLTLGGRVSGQITDSGGVPLPNVTVNVFDKSTGNMAASGMTNSLGNYVVLGIPAGTYAAQTSNSIGYLDKVFDNLASAGWGSSVASVGTSIPVTVGSTTANINFTLAKGGLITGTITDATTLAPLPNVSVQVYDAANRYVSQTFSTPKGTYATGGLAPGTYFLKTTSNPQGYVNQLYQGQTCMSCMATTGTPVVVSSTNTTSGVDFSLRKGGAVSGTVTDVVSGAGLAGVSVTLYDGGNAWVGSSMTGATGTYTIQGLATGSYYAKTSAGGGYINQLYPGLTCTACGVTGGTPIAVTVGATASNINFALASGGGISGTVTNSGGVPIGSLSLTIYAANGQYVQSISTDPQGRYQTTAGLTAGTYFVRANGSMGYVSELYDGKVCVSCSPTTGTPVTVTATSTTTGVNFVLPLGGEVTGQVTSSGSDAQPLNYVNVQFYTPSGTFVASARTNPSGAYRVAGLPDGAYVARTFNDQGFVDQLYSGVPCLACNIGVGTRINVTAGQATSSINFALAVGGRILGTVRDATTGAPLPGVRVDFFNAAGRSVTYGVSDPSGRFRTNSGLPTGTYYAQTANSIGYLDEVYDNLDYWKVYVQYGTPIEVTAGADTTGIDISLVAGARVAGTVTDAATGQPIAKAQVVIYGADGQQAGFATTGTAGTYITSNGLAAGRYYAKASSAMGHVSSLYNGISCAFCSPLTGTPIDVPASGTVGNIDFALSAGGRITGTVTDPLGVPQAGVLVSIFTDSNIKVSTATTDAAGQYVSGIGLPTDTYFARTNNSLGYVDKVYDNTVCLACKATTGTPISVTLGQTTSSIDFMLGSGGRISGTVRDADTGQPLASVSVAVFDAQGTNVSSGGTDNAGNYLTPNGLPAGTYYLRTRNSQGYVDALYQGQLCLLGMCNPTRGTPVTVTAGAITADINFDLSVGGQIAGTVTAAEGGAGIGGVKVSLYNASGAQLGSGYTNTAGSFTSPALPVGRYFVRTTNEKGYVDELFDNLTCAPCTILNGRGIDVIKGATVGNVNFALDTGGLVTGYVTDSGTGAPLANVTVSFYLADGTYVATSQPTTESGYYAISLPVGTYVARVDALDGYVVTIASGSRARADGMITVTKGQETSGVAFPLTSCTPPTLAPEVLPTVTKSVPYTGALTATGGTTPYTFSVTDGLLTPGLALSGRSGDLSGTPQTVGTAGFTIAAVDATGCSTTRTYAQYTCGISLGSTSATFAPTVGQGAVDIRTDAADCQWGAASSVDWITITTRSGTGPGTVSFTVADNPSPLSVRSGTITVAGQEFTVRQLPLQTAAPFGVVDTPVQNAMNVMGSIAVTGWALDDVGVASVKVYRNCLSFEPAADCAVIDGANLVYLGTATFISGARPDVEALYPTAAQPNRAGWGYLMLTNLLPHVPTGQMYGGQGGLTLYFIATDIEGHRTFLGRTPNIDHTPTSVTLNNDAIAKPFGAIDTPSQGETVSGTIYNFGWALTPDTNTTGGEPGDILLPTNGSTMWAFLDGVPVAPTITYNQCRGNNGQPTAGWYCNDDVSNLYGNLTPQPLHTPRTGNPTKYRNLDEGRAPIGYFALDTTRLANGLHQIAWSVTDSANRTEGIGSRYFVLNATTRPEARAVTLEVSRLDASLTTYASASGLDAMPLASTVTGADSVTGRTGFDVHAPIEDLPADTAGVRYVQLPPLGRVELWLGPVDAGYLVANHTLRDLPAGASLDLAVGRFAWAPGPAFLGTYRLVFLRAGAQIPVEITIEQEPATAADAGGVRMHLDTPRPGAELDRSFVVAGWALDPQAAVGHGIGGVHVWAHRRDIPGAAPIFLGAATLGLARPDVEAVHGASFRAAGFGLTSPALSPGRYEITAYVWRTRTRQWEDARSATVTVR